MNVHLDVYILATVYVLLQKEKVVGSLSSKNTRRVRKLPQFALQRKYLPESS
jgi:hypothetical protein